MRLFLALDLPEEVRGAIAAWRGPALRGRDELRPVDERDLHVTLAFLGSTAPERVEAVWEAASGAAAGCAAPVLSAAGVTGVPSRRPRLFALDLVDDGGRAAALSATVAGALGAAGLHEPEERPFWPHLTFARVRRGARAAPLVAGVPALEPFVAPAMTLYRSDPARRPGARYAALERFELRGE